MKQAWDAETVGFHSDDGKAFPPPTPKKEERFPRPVTGQHRLKNQFRAGKRGAWCLVKPSAIPRLFTVVHGPHSISMEFTDNGVRVIKASDKSCWRQWQRVRTTPEIEAYIQAKIDPGLCQA